MKILTTINKIPYVRDETKTQYKARLLRIDLRRAPKKIPEPQSSGPTFTFHNDPTSANYQAHWQNIKRDQADFVNGFRKGQDMRKRSNNLRDEYMRKMKEGIFRNGF